MMLTRRGEHVAIATVLLWGASVALQSTVAALAATLLSAALAGALFRVRSPRVAAVRDLPGTQFVESQSFRARIDCTLRSPRTARVTLRELASAGLTPLTQSQVTLALTAGTPQALEVAWDARTWGHHTVGPTVLLIRDTLCLVEEQIEIAPAEKILVKPKSAPLGKYKAPARRASVAAGAYPVSKPGDGGEFFTLRPYHAGDSIRRINWKASVRGGETIVNQVSHENFAKVLVVVDLREKERVGDSGDSVLIQNGRAAAAVCDHHRRVRDSINLLLLTGEAKLASRSTNPNHDDLMFALAETPIGGNADLESAIRAHLHLIRPKSPIYVCTSGALDASLASAIRTVSTLGARAVVISPAAPKKAEAWPEYAASRGRALASVRSLGVRVVDWTSESSLEAAFASR